MATSLDAGPCLDDILSNHGLQRKDLERQCPPGIRIAIATKLEDWKTTGRYFGLPAEKLAAIDRENATEDQRRNALLECWEKREGRSASCLKLADVLHRRERRDLVELLCTELKLSLTLSEKGNTLNDGKQLQSRASAPTETELCEIPNSSSTRRSPLPPRPSPTPPLSSTTPATETLSPIATSLEEKIEQLDEECTEIERLVLQTIKRKVPHTTMLEWIQVLPMPLKSQFSELLQRNAKELSNASNVDELFIIISPYWNALHPTLLSHLVKNLADEKLKRRMKEYTDDLCEFRSHTRLGDLIEKWAGGVPPGFDEFCIKLGEEWREKTVEDFEQFRIHLSRQKCIGGHMTYMMKVTPGCISVELALPQCCFPLTFDRDMRKFLKEEDVLGVYVGGLCILDLHQAESQIVQQLEKTAMGDNDQLRNFLSRKLRSEIVQHFRTRPQNAVEVSISEEELRNLLDVGIQRVEKGTDLNSNERYAIIKGRGSYEIQVNIKMQQGARIRRTSVGGGVAGFFGGGGAGAGIGALVGIIGGPIGVGIGLAIGAGAGAVVGAVVGATGGVAAGTKVNMRSGNTQCKLRDILPRMGTEVSADNDDYLQVKITY